MLEQAWPRFATNVVTGNAWNPEQSQLTTYWVNACLHRSVRAVLRWAREQTDRRGATDTLVRRSQRNMCAAIEDREQYRRIIDTAPGPVQPILTLLALDYDYAEIADRLRIRRTTVANRLFDFRKKIVLPAMLDGDLHAPTGHVLHEITERVQEAWS